MTRRLFVLSALLVVGGCSLDKQNAPGLTGPSELGLSLAISATPDVITQDGVSQSQIEVIARDASSQPVRGLSMRVETAIVQPDGSTIVADIGSLSARTISTNNDGRASVTFVAPPPPPPTAGSDTTVTLIVTPIGSNYQNTMPRTVAVRLARPGVILPPNSGPKAAFFYSPTSPKEGDVIQFDGSTSSDPDGVIVSYAWNFGDGESGSGVRPTHSYDLGGTYNVVLTVTDDRGLTNSTLPTAVVVSSSSDPVAAFTISPTDPVAGGLVSVNGAISKAAPGRRIVSYEWDFGDGSGGATGATASHVYAQPGTYVIVLIVTDDLGKTGSAAEEVEVQSSGPKAAFTVTPSSPLVGVAASFNASASTAQPGRTITSYQWDFGDGATGTNVTTTHAYAAPGTYTVTLLVTDSAGQTGTISRTVTVVTP